MKEFQLALDEIGNPDCWPEPYVVLDESLKPAPVQKRRLARPEVVLEASSRRSSYSANVL
jgi:hypothetical protein